MRGSNLKNIVNIQLYKCHNYLQLPPFGQLPSLQILENHGMDEVLDYIENEYPSGGGFPSLVELDVNHCPNLKGLSREDGRELFRGLRKICISNCPKLSLPHLSSPKELWFSGKCTMLKVLPDDLASLGTLKSLEILRCPKLESLPKEGLRGLESLQSLHINYCPKITSLP
ncbi:unnamed protein product [Camellia sinensis]